MREDDAKKSLLEQYIDLSKNSLIKVQYSCGGNSTGIDETDYIPIVPDSYVSESNLKTVDYGLAREEDAEAIVALLRINNLAVSDLGVGNRVFLVALLAEKTIGCVAVEVYGDAGLLRSLAVNNDFRGKGIGKRLVTEAETWCRNNGLKSLYLLTTTADGFFPKIGWHITERSSVPEGITLSSEFSSVCPSTAVCMMKELE
ncbi:MAG: arsenic resistance N-acetyltransferase ArsN2 [Paludibacter sp.]